MAIDPDVERELKELTAHALAYITALRNHWHYELTNDIRSRMAPILAGLVCVVVDDLAEVIGQNPEDLWRQWSLEWAPNL